MELLVDEQGEYMEALRYFLKVEKLIPTTSTPADPNLSNSRAFYAHHRLPSKMHILNNIGRSYQRKRDYKLARTYYTKALDEQNSSVEKAAVYNTLGQLEFLQSNYEQARLHFTQAVDLGKDHRLIKEYKQSLEMINTYFLRAVGC